ncbi:MAG: hypothetical protein MI923_08615 [Phycisphaerales bacterium]|nr:hypothetical protein [Phycisphaerales bacterium]
MNHHRSGSARRDTTRAHRHSECASPLAAGGTRPTIVLSGKAGLRHFVSTHRSKSRDQ